MQLDRVASETRNKQSISEEGEKQAAAASGAIKDLKLVYADATKRFGVDRCFKVITCQDLTSPFQFLLLQHNCAFY